MAAFLAPKCLAGFAMGLWMPSVSAANYLGGLISGVVDIPDDVSTLKSGQIYETAFVDFGLIALAPR